MYYDYLYSQSQYSLISQNFFNVITNKISCQNCGVIYYFNIEKILTFNLDEYSFIRGLNCINLNDLFKYYTHEMINCNICEVNKAINNRKFFCPSKVLIIYFKRYSHSFKCDVNFTNKITIKDYISSKNFNEIDFSPCYFLKACISYNDKGNYYTYINTNSNWKIYSNNNFKIIDNPEKEISRFEPQILIYELDNYNLINNRENQIKQKNVFDCFNYKRKLLIEYQEKIINEKEIRVIFCLIPYAEYKGFKAKYSDKFEDIVDKFYYIYKIPRKEYKLFICNSKKIQPNSKKKLGEILYIHKIKSKDILIYCIKDI